MATNAHMSARTALGLAGLGASALWLVLSLTRPHAVTGALPPAPALTIVETACSATIVRAAERARTAEASALQRIERYPFAPREALVALAALSEAANCYMAAGETRSRMRVTDAIHAWRTRIERDYRAHVLRFRLALASGRDEQRDRDARFLSELLGDDTGPYSQWLRHLQATATTVEEDDP
jgi:hypothetical protein